MACHSRREEKSSFSETSLCDQNSIIPFMHHHLFIKFNIMLKLSIEFIITFVIYIPSFIISYTRANLIEYLYFNSNLKFDTLWFIMNDGWIFRYCGQKSDWTTFHFKHNLIILMDISRSIKRLDKYNACAKIVLY